MRTKSWVECNALGTEEKDAAMRVMDGGRLSLFQGVYTPPPPYSFLGGPEVQALETAAREKTGTKHAVAMNSATSGLFTAVGALGLGFGDEVIVSPYTMSACAVAPLLFGAIPVFADVLPDSSSLDPMSVRERITDRTKAIIVVHQFGIPAEMDAIMQIARERRIAVIEDCAQAWGARYKGASVGAIGSVGVFSLNVHKTIQCGEGGICVTDDDETALRLRLIRNHGEAAVEAAEYENIVNMIGGNYRLTEIQAAIASEQLKKLDRLNADRIAMADAFYEGIGKYGCFIPPTRDNRVSTYYVCPLRYLPDHLKGTTRSALVRMLEAEGIPFSPGYVKPIYLLPMFQKRLAFKHGYPWTAPENRASNPSYAKGTCPVAERLNEVELLVQAYLGYPQTMDDVEDILAGVEKVLSSIS